MLLKYLSKKLNRDLWIEDLCSWQSDTMCAFQKMMMVWKTLGLDISEKI